MYRVLRIINRFNLGGPTYNVAYLTKYLGPDFDTLLVGGEKEATEESSMHILDKLELKPRFINAMQREINFKKDREAYLEIKKLIKEYQPHIVHTHASKSGALGRLSALSENVPIVVHTFHGHVFEGYFNPLKTAFFKTVERYLAKKSSAIIALSQKQKEEIVKKHKISSEKNTHVIPLGFDLGRFTENKAANRKAFREKYNINNKVVVGIIGRLVPIKNHLMFLKAIEHVKQKEERKALGVIIGDGESREYVLTEAMRLGLNVSFNDRDNQLADILFLSWEKEVHKVLPGLDIVALTSKNEGTPVSLIEAQTAGIPVISTKVGAIANIVLENKSGFLVESADQEAFNHKLEKLVFDEPLRHSFAGAATQKMLDSFGYQRLASDMHSLYIKLLKEQGLYV